MSLVFRFIHHIIKHITDTSSVFKSITLTKRTDTSLVAGSFIISHGIQAIDSTSHNIATYANHDIATSLVMT
jgi:hypothetical protein